MVLDYPIDTLPDTNRLQDYRAYHNAMIEIGDMDPAYPILVYVASRYEMNMEQRYWLAFLYAATYCVPTAFYIWNEFPDWENVDLGRLERWWSANRERVIFQTDRAWIRSRNQFVDHVASYTERIGAMSQEERFLTFIADSPEHTYNNAYKYMIKVYQLGRYSMFLYLEAVHALTDFPIMPGNLDLKNSQSSRNGLCYALGYDGWLCGHDYGRKTLDSSIIDFLGVRFDWLVSELFQDWDDGSTNVWSVETSLCAYKKIHRGTRYLGYYIDRQHSEITKMQSNVPEGVDWQPLWDFREVHYAAPWLKEYRQEVNIDPVVLRPSDPELWYHRTSLYGKSNGRVEIVSNHNGLLVTRS